MNAGEVRQGAAWSSRFAFLYACAGAAIGLGSLWRFPYVAGANGGGAFVLLFLLFVALLCVPLMMAEMLIGRRGGGSAILSVGKMILGERALGAWGLIGWLSILIPFFGLSYYSVVAGWGLDYVRVAIFEGFASYDGARSVAKFSELTQDPWRQGLLQGLFIVAAATVVALGVRRGIEWASRVKMVGLLVIIVALIVYGARTYGLERAADYLFRPSFAALTSEGVLAALGQALFATAIGAGVLMTYSAYLPRRMSLAQASLAINGSVAAVATLAGLAIFPAVFANGLEPTGGPSLIFVTLPTAFSTMPGGQIVGALFFVMIVLAAFTVAVGMLEPVVAFLLERTGARRVLLAYATAFIIFAIGLPSLLSFNVLKDFHPLKSVPIFADKTVFDLLDFTIANILFPLNALLISLFVGWGISGATVGEELALQGLAARLWRFSVRFLSPLLILGLMIKLVVDQGS